MRGQRRGPRPQLSNEHPLRLIQPMAAANVREPLAGTTPKTPYNKPDRQQQSERRGIDQECRNRHQFHHRCNHADRPDNDCAEHPPIENPWQHPRICHGIVKTIRTYFTSQRRGRLPLMKGDLQGRLCLHRARLWAASSLRRLVGPPVAIDEFKRYIVLVAKPTQVDRKLEIWSRYVAEHFSVGNWMVVSDDSPETV
jgi:hypothetical protein